MLAVSAGLIFCAGGFVYTKKIPKNVTVDGVAVGGLNLAEAVRLVRAETENNLKDKTLEICAGDKVFKFTYPEISYRDNVFTLLKNAEKGKSYRAETSYFLCGAEEIARGICLSEQRLKTEPYAQFSAYGKPFTYFEGNDGRKVDEKQILRDIDKSLNGGFERVNVKFTTQFRTETLDKIKAETRLLSSFTTRFDGGNLNRVSNIRLAASKINGAVLESGKTLSFNDIVGARVKERGFLTAKIILTILPFVSRTGQPALRSKRSPAFTQKIKNNRKTPIYIRANVTDGSVTFDIYGKSDGAKYSLKSSVTGNIPAPEEVTDDPAKVRAGKDGLLSEGYIEITRAGVTESKLLRRDKYRPVNRRILTGTASENSQETTEETAENQD